MMETEFKPDLPPDIVVLPAALYRGEWVFHLVTSVRADDTGGGCTQCYGEAEYRASLAEQGYEAAQIDWAVAEAIAEGKAAPPEPDEDEPF